MTQRPTLDEFFASDRYSPTLAFTPDGEDVVYVSNRSGQSNIWRVPAAGGTPDQLTSFTDRTVRALAVSPADGTIAFTADAHGGERTEVYALRPRGGLPERWTEAPDAQHQLAPGAWSPDGSRLAYSGNSRTPADMDVIVRELASGEAKAIFGEGMYAIALNWSPDGRFLLAVDERSNTDTAIHLIDLEKGEAREIAPADGEAMSIPGPWLPDGSGFHLLTNEGRDYAGLALYSLADGGYEWVERPELEVEEIAASRDGRVLAWLENDRGWGRLRLRDLTSGGDLPAPALPAGCAPQYGSAICLSHDGARAALLWTSSTSPASVWIVDTATGSASELTEGRLGALAERGLAPAQLVAYPTFDDREIAAWLHRAPGNAPGPAVLAIHGGPELQERPWYQPLYQYLCSRGISVLAPNVRGSTGYGQSYQRLIHRDWGGGDLCDWDHAARWLRRQEWVDASRLGVFGSSYGGFGVLSCVTRLPDHWAAAVDIFGASNLVTLAEAAPPTWRSFVRAMIGDPEQDREFLLERSPITYVERARAPLLVIQGANDYRVPRQESDRMVDRLRELGLPVEYVVFEDEGHGFMRRENELRAYRHAADWLERHLLGSE